MKQISNLQRAGRDALGCHGYQSSKSMECGLVANSSEQEWVLGPSLGTYKIDGSSSKVLTLAPTPFLLLLLISDEKKLCHGCSLVLN